MINITNSQKLIKCVKQRKGEKNNIIPLTFFTRAKVSGLDATRVQPLAWYRKDNIVTSLKIRYLLTLKTQRTNDLLVCKSCMGLDSQFLMLYRLRMDQQMFFSQNVDSKQFDVCLQKQCAPLPVRWHSCTPHMSCFFGLTMFQIREYRNPQNQEITLD